MKFRARDYFLIVVIILLLGIGFGTVYKIFAATGGTASSSNSIRQSFADANGLVAWYPLDASGSDLSGNSYTGTLTNFTYDGTTNGWVQGKFGKGLLFNGTNDYVTASPPTTFGFGDSTFSVSFWAKMTASASSSTILAYGNAGCSGWKLQQYNATTVILYSKGSSCNTSLNDSFASGVIDNGNWHFYVVEITTSTTVAASNTATLYVDGASQTLSVSTPSYTYNPPTTGATLTMGESGASGYWPGTLDDVRVYSRALTTGEISNLYSGSSPASCDQTCVTYLKFDNNTGTSATDSTGNGFTGTTHGTVTWTSGNFASGLLLDGSSGYVSMANLGLTSGTIDMWINPTTVSGNQTIFSQLSGASSQAGSIMLNGTSGLSGSLYLWNGSAYVQLAPANTILAGQWNQIIVENNGSTATAFVNGSQRETQSSGGFSFSGPTASIGDEFLGTTGSFFNGEVDDFRVYNRMLALEEVEDQWKNGS